MSVDVGNMATGSTDKSIKLWRLLVGVHWLQQIGWLYWAAAERGCGVG